MAKGNGSVYSRRKPLKIKQVQMNILIDDEICEISVCKSDTVTMVIQRASHSVERKLKPFAVDSNYFTIQDLYDFILTMTINRTLRLNSVWRPGPEYVHGQSISKLSSTNNKISEYDKNYELYTHWFCMKIYDKFFSDPDNETQEFSDRFKQIMDLGNPSLLQQDELSYTSILYHELDRYLFPKKEDGYLIHQPVLIVD